MIKNDLEFCPFKEGGIFPKQIGGYKIEGVLSRSRKSTVFLAAHPETYEPIAVKILSKELVSRSDMVDAFLSESKIISMTDHPNIVKLYGHGHWEGGLYLATEFVQGISLREVILQETMFLRKASSAILQIAHALVHLHSHGIIHRDLKPENILLTKEGGIKLIDFGISYLFNNSNENLVAKGFAGTPGYMSPEQKRNPLNISFSTDIYALGVIAYELVLGRLSYGRIMLSLLPNGMQKIVNKALQPDPCNRYDDIVDFVKDLSIYMRSDQLKKDMRGNDFLGELNEDLKKSTVLLCPLDTHTQPNGIEIAVKTKNDAATPWVYYDWVQVNQHYCYIVLAQSFMSGIEGLLKTAMLKGLVLGLSNLYNAKDFFRLLRLKLDLVPASGHDFLFSFLTLNMQENRLTYTSCGGAPLWTWSSTGDNLRSLNASNPSLGLLSVKGPVIMEAPWHVGSGAVLHAFHMDPEKVVHQPETKDMIFKNVLQDSLFLRPAKQVEAVSLKMSQKKMRAFNSNPLTIISVKRVA
ncbi:hypothetical protein CLAVI_000290 [Candidatus Clavichlamydia salmonicola]|uniref:serine/threonine protein kinase n=1 Tax=Candidatus Clavichlamydia salmonicola TaxID=469812 RepID=UPI0018919FF2|nr:serine/threonine-protein kinase [Candidatus Clavichlamydia salmonicola]MBF5050675.1 hypothetical protein [Candidatus Clavichlamydia salmonicola]